MQIEKAPFAPGLFCFQPGLAEIFLADSTSTADSSRIRCSLVAAETMKQMQATQRPA